MKYRVLMEDSVNGKKFNFAMTYDACDHNCAFDAASAEFHSASIVSFELVEQPEVILP